MNVIYSQILIIVDSSKFNYLHFLQFWANQNFIYNMFETVHHPHHHNHLIAQEVYYFQGWNFNKFGEIFSAFFSSLSILTLNEHITSLFAWFGFFEWSLWDLILLHHQRIFHFFIILSWAFMFSISFGFVGPFYFFIS